jgi:hypothetical protein
LLGNGAVLIGDGKDKYFAKALAEQFPVASTVLKEKGYRVTGGVIVAELPTTTAYADHSEAESTWKIIGDLREKLAANAHTFSLQKPACNPSRVCLLNDFDRFLQDPSKPSGFAIAPFTKYPVLETHIHCPYVDPQRGHVLAGPWSYLHPFTIPTAPSSTVRIAFVR